MRSVRFSEPGEVGPGTSGTGSGASKKRVHPMRRKHKLQGIDDLPPKKRKRQQQQQQQKDREQPADDDDENVPASASGSNLPFAQFDDEDGQNWEDENSSSEEENDKSRVKRTKLGELDWRSIETPSSVSLLDGEGGMLMLEEVDDVDVQWEHDGKGGKKAVLKKVATRPDARSKAKKEKKSKVQEKKSSKVVEEQNSEDDSEMSDGAPKADQAEAVHAADPAFDDSLLPLWTEFPLHPLIKRGLHKLGFTDPTEIQKRAIPVALQSGKDVVGVAETGSGKTLAYSLPILHDILSSPVRDGLTALILCPTRELALQVSKHISALMHAAGSPQRDGRPRVSVASVVGGLSALKQKRLLQRGCDVLVATPGRLWDMIQDDESLATQIKRSRYFVVDEADRMIENGHFAELESIANLVERQDPASVAAASKVEEDSVFARAERKIDSVQPRDNMQTFIFSATLSKDLQSNLKRRKSGPARKKAAQSTTLDDLFDRLDFRDLEPEVINLSPEGGLVRTIRESIVECLTSDKDLYLYYFLLRYPGRSLVFVGSIDGIRRLVPLFEILKMPVFPLHSQLQQKQRLKNLDRFASSKSGVLIATDVAARGLDIPAVEHVVHFQLPRTADAYIHRSGRTARAKADGFSLQMCSPEERRQQVALMRSLDRPADLPELQVEPGFLPKLKERLRIAKEIENARHKVKKKRHDDGWLKEAAEAMDIDLDPDLLSESDSEERPTSKPGKTTSAGRLVNLQAELADLLRQPLMARGVSAKYPTAGSRVIVDDLLDSKGHGSLLGASTRKAHEDIDAKGPKRSSSYKDIRRKMTGKA